VFIAVLISVCNSDLISSSRVQDCVLDGSSSTEDLGLVCDRKMVVSLVLSNGQVRFVPLNC
jgi:hypothetical protein